MFQLSQTHFLHDAFRINVFAESPLGFNESTMSVTSVFLSGPLPWAKFIETDEGKMSFVCRNWSKKITHSLAKAMRKSNKLVECGNGGSNTSSNVITCK